MDFIDKKLTLNTEHSALNYKLIEPGKGLIYHLQELVKSEKIKTLGFEAEDLKYLEDGDCIGRIKETVYAVNC